MYRPLPSTVHTVATGKEKKCIINPINAAGTGNGGVLCFYDTGNTN